MTQENKVSLVQTLLGGDNGATDALVSAFLEQAKVDILNRMYPFEIPDDVTDVPVRYEMLECKLARNYYLRMGSEGEKTHNENGINRSYGSVNDDELLSEVVPFVRMV